MPTPLKQLIASQSADLCRCYGVRRLGVFGSVARGEERADSDIDFLVEFENLGPEHMADRYFGFIEDATRRFGRPVQVLTRGLRGLTDRSLHLAVLAFSLLLPRRRGSVNSVKKSDRLVPFLRLVAANLPGSAFRVFRVFRGHSAVRD